MRAIVNDAIHIEVEVVNNGDDGSPARLIDERVALAKPAIKFGNTHGVKLYSPLVINKHQFI